MNQIQRPIVLRMDDAKQELVGSINNIMQVYGLSPYLLEPMFAEMYAQIKASAQNELAQARENEAKAQMAKQTAKDGAE